MDMPLKRFKRAGAHASFAPDVGMLLAGIAARQAASPTSNAQAALSASSQELSPGVSPMIAIFSAPRARFRRSTACFNAGVAASLTPNQP